MSPPSSLPKGSSVKDECVRRMTPNVVTFNTMLKAARVDGRGVQSFSRCQEIIGHMLERQVHPDSVTINTLVTACVAYGKLDEAEAFLYMEGAPGDYPGGLDVGDGISDGHSGSNLGRRTPAPFNSVAPGVEAYSSLISGYAAACNEKGAFRIYSTMRRNGVSPRKFTLTALVDACLRAGPEQTREEASR